MSFAVFVTIMHIINRHINYRDEVQNNMLTLTYIIIIKTILIIPWTNWLEGIWFWFYLNLAKFLSTLNYYVT